MNQRLIISIFLVVGFLIVGCATSGNKALKEETKESVAQKITKGETTEEEVRSMFGDPLSVGFTDTGKQQWHYMFTKTQVTASSLVPVVGLFKSGANSKIKTLVILFDDSGVVMNYSLSNSDIQTETGLIQ